MPDVGRNFRYTGEGREDTPAANATFKASLAIGGCETRRRKLETICVRSAAEKPGRNNDRAINFQVFLAPTCRDGFPSCPKFVVSNYPPE